LLCINVDILTIAYVPSLFLGLLPPSNGTSSVLYLNGTRVTLPTNIDTSARFSFYFLACSQGVILTQGNDLTIALEQPASNKTSHHTVLSVEGTNLQKTFISPRYSLDSNVLINVDIRPNSTGLLIMLTPDASQVNGRISAVEKFVKGDLAKLNGRQNLILGSTTFAGCIYNGFQISVDSKKSLSCPLDDWAPCNNQGNPKLFCFIDGYLC
jgi:hypothetical protein